MNGVTMWDEIKKTLIKSNIRQFRVVKMFKMDEKGVLFYFESNGLPFSMIYDNGYKVVLGFLPTEKQEIFNHLGGLNIEVRQNGDI